MLKICERNNPPEEGDFTDMESEEAAKMEMQEPSAQDQHNSENSNTIDESLIVEATPAADTAADTAARLATDDPAEAERHVDDTAAAAGNTSVPEQAAESFEAEGDSRMGLQEEVNAGASEQAKEAPAAWEATAVLTDQQAAPQSLEHGDSQHEPAQTATVEAPVAAPSKLELEPSSKAAAPQAKGSSRPASSSRNVTQEPTLAKADNASQQSEAAPESAAAGDAPTPTAAKPLSAKAAAAPAPTTREEPAGSGPAKEHYQTIKAHKETTVERLTTPTAMRMLKALQKTQGDKTDWHIATGVVFKGKKLDADEMAAMVDRLCVAKHHEDDMPPKPHAVKLVYEDNKETYVPVKEVTKDESIGYMSELYSRCQETRAKTQQQLADKYLQPLVRPKVTAKKPAAIKTAAE